MPDTLQLQIIDQVAHVSLSRPTVRNAINSRMLDELREVISTLIARGIRLGVLSGEGGTFCSGNDRNEIEETGKFASMDFIRLFCSSPIFWIGKISGPAVGAGVALAAVCPVTVATKDTWFSLPERTLGLFPAGVFAYLEPLVGKRAAYYRCSFLGGRVGAAEALDMGLINRVVDKRDLDTEINQIANNCKEAEDRFLVGARKVWQSQFNSVEFERRSKELLGYL